MLETCLLNNSLVQQAIQYACGLLNNCFTITNKTDWVLQNMEACRKTAVDVLYARLRPLTVHDLVISGYITALSVRWCCM